MKKILQFVFGSLAVLGFLLFFCLKSLPDGKLHVFVLDVGQGDAILIQTPAGEHILIDGGPSDRVIEQLSKVMPFYERTIESIILTHPHADHINGLIDVLKRYEVKQVVMTGVSSHSSAYSAFLKLSHSQKVAFLFAGDGNDYQIGGLTLDMLYPFSTFQNQKFENLNNSSIVFRLLYGMKAFYFSGDLEIDKETELVNSKLDLHADFLKSGHHGSRTSNSEPLLERIQPLVAAISCGIKNSFGHPHPITIEHFQRKHIKIYRTDLDGIIEVVSDGEYLDVKTKGK